MDIDKKIKKYLKKEMISESEDGTMGLFNAKPRKKYGRCPHCGKEIRRKDLE